MPGSPASSVPIIVPLDDLPAGALAQTIPRWAVLNAALTLLSQRVQLTSVQLTAGVTYTSITYVSGSTALGAGVHQLFGIYDDSLGSTSGTARALLRGTVDDGAAAWAANTAKTLALTAAYTAARTGTHFVAILVDAGTVPTINGGVGGSNLVGALSQVSYGVANTGVTALPNPASVPGGQNSLAYAYLS